MNEKIIYLGFRKCGNGTLELVMGFDRLDVFNECDVLQSICTFINFFIEFLLV